MNKLYVIPTVATTVLAATLLLAGTQCVGAPASPPPTAIKNAGAAGSSSATGHRGPWSSYTARLPMYSGFAALAKNLENDEG